MQFFVSKNHDRLNQKVFAPERIAERLCLNPSYPVSVKQNGHRLQIMLDSGAFQDLQTDDRLTFQGALDRQLEYERTQGVAADFIVSYDRIVDESPTIQGTRKKRRVDGRRARWYVRDTINAAKYLADQRRDLKPHRLVLSNQGVFPDQYLGCLKEVLKFAEPSDVIGFGGFCIVGQIPRFTEDYFEVLARALPLIRRKGIRRIHVFGVGVFKILVKTHVMCARSGIIPSYDTSSLELNAVYGRTLQPDYTGMGPAGVHLTTVFSKQDKYRLYHPCEWAMFNIRIVNEFWRGLNKLYPLPHDNLRAARSSRSVHH